MNSTPQRTLRIPGFEFNFPDLQRSASTENIPNVTTANSNNDIEGGGHSPLPAINGNTLNFNMSQQISPDLLSNRVKFIFLFMVLLGLKFLVDNIFPSIVLISGTLVLMRLRKEHNIQLSAKKKSNAKVMIVLFIFAFVQLAVILKFVQLYGSPDRIDKRLILYRYYSSDISLQSILWSHLIVDGVVQISLLAFKVLLCGLGDLNIEPILTYIRKMITGEFAPPLTSATSPPTNTNTNLNNASSSAVHSNTFMSPTSSSQRHPLLGHTTSSSSSSSAMESNYLNSNNHTDDNISNSSSSDREAEKYIVKLRLCAMVDIFGLLYRSLLTMPGWFAYFSSAAVGSTPFSCLYLGCKALDLCVKGYGAIDAVSFFIQRRPEFGHYSTVEELNSPAFCCDCPICFDSPLNKPITLGCNHSFCEVCISEWLDKEKSCPVCRSQVVFVSSTFAAVKEQAASALPVLI